MRVVDNKGFIAKAKSVHGGKYGYESVDYRSTREKVEILCPVHGLFRMTPENHLRGDVCQKCSRDIKNEKIRSSNEKSFLSQAYQIYGDRYGLSNIDYKNARTNVTIRCKVHGDFEKAPYHFLGGQGCPECAETRRVRDYRRNIVDVIEQAKRTHGNLYQYDESNKLKMVWSTDEIDIRCPYHGWFTQNIGRHIRGNGCRKCGLIRNSSDFEEWELNIPCLLYYVLIEEESTGFIFCKIGTTRETLPQRFKKPRYAGYTITPIKTISGTLRECIISEERILQYLYDINQRYRTSHMKGKFHGWSECFYPIVRIPDDLMTLDGGEKNET